MWLTNLLKKIFVHPDNPVSEADQFLQKFDAKHPEQSISQQAEIAKHQKIAKLRGKH